jgi:hypothetical protein
MDFIKPDRSEFHLTSNKNKNKNKTNSNQSTTFNRVIRDPKYFIRCYAIFEGNEE